MAALSLGTPAIVQATVEAYPLTGAVLKDLREYAGTGFGGESAHSIRLDFLVGPPLINNYPQPTAPQGYTVSRVRRYSYKSFGVDPAYFGSLTSNGSLINGGTSSTGEVNLTGTTPFEFRFPGAATRTIYVNFKMTTLWDLTNSQGTVFPDASDTYTASYSATLNLTRRDVEMVSIDSRRVYGQPNLDGEIPADPNADLRNPSFAGWVFRGGLFVGNATGNDQSGTARIQGWIPTATLTDPLMSSLTLRALGQPTGYAAPTLQAYVPASNDPNIGASSSTVTWANRWDLAAATLVGDPAAIGTLPANEYYRLRFLETPSKIGIALSGESPSSGGYWQYFASEGYESGYPLADSRPRLWTVDKTSSTQNITPWQYWDGVTQGGNGPPRFATRARLPRPAGRAILGGRR